MSGSNASGSDASSNASQQQPSPADLARELIRLRERATQGTWEIENSQWTGKPYNVLVENVIDGQVFHPWVLMKFLDGWSPSEADAAIIAYAVNHARTIAEALLAAEEDNADLRGNIFPQVRIIAKELVEVKTINEELRAKLAAAEARVNALEAACEKALAVIPNLLARSWPSNSPMKQDAEDALRAVLAKGKGATA